MEDLLLDLLLEDEKDNTFNPAHYRPSSVGSCLRQEALRVLHHIEPENEKWFPVKPHGKKDIYGMAKLGHAIEAVALEQIKESLKDKARIFSQWEIKAPGLLNEDGTPVVAHPDGYSRKLGLDIEIKSVFVTAIPRLPIQSHLEQHLLRLYWESCLGAKNTGLLYYFFRETFYEPRGNSPIRFIISPSKNGFIVNDSNNNVVKEVFLDEVKNLHQRLVDLKGCVGKRSLPPRFSEDHNSFPCLVRGEHFLAECPWREMCFREEISKEKEPGIMVEAAGELALQLLEQREKQKPLNKELNSIKKKTKEVQNNLDYFFNELNTEKISAAGLTVSRTKVDKKETVISPCSYYLYNIRRQ